MATVISTVHTAADNAMTYSFTFPYLSGFDVKVELAGVPETHFTVSGFTITWTDAQYRPANGTEIVIYRDTNVSALITTWTGKTYIDPENLDLQAKQSLYALQEIESGSDEVALNALDSRVTTLEDEEHTTQAYVDAADAALDSAINGKASIFDVVNKADKAYVDIKDDVLQGQLDAKAYTTYVDAADASLLAKVTTKAEQTYVDGADATTLQAAKDYTDANGGGGGGGASALTDLDDVDTTGVTDGQVLTYSNASSEWQPADSAGGGGGGFSGVDQYSYVFGYDGETNGNISLGAGTFDGSYYTPAHADGLSVLQANPGNTEGTSLTLDGSETIITFTASGTYEVNYDIPYVLLPTANTQQAVEWYFGTAAVLVSLTGAGALMDNAATLGLDFPGLAPSTSTTTVAKGRFAPGPFRIVVDHTNAALRTLQMYVAKGTPLKAGVSQAEDATFGVNTTITRVA